jgi:hypothetical protein
MRPNPPGKLWRTLRSGTTVLFVEWGPSRGKVFATDVKMREGPPITLAVSLEKNFRTRSTDEGAYLDAQALAEGGLRELRLVEISDDRILKRLRHHLEQIEEPTSRWRLLINLRGQHEYDVEPEVRLLGASQDLLLNVVGAASA